MGDYNLSGLNPREFEHLIQALASGQAGMPGMMPGQFQMINGMQMAMQPQQIAMERNAFNSQDIISLAWIAPIKPDTQQLDQLGQILRQSIDMGNAVEDFIAKARLELKKPAGESAYTERQVAKLLFGAGFRRRDGRLLTSRGAQAEHADPQRGDRGGPSNTGTALAEPSQGHLVSSSEHETCGDRGNCEGRCAGLSNRRTRR